MRITRVGAAAATGLVALLLTTPVPAQTSRTWVSHNGNHHNDCSMSHPCRTFHRAHDALDPNRGEVNALNSGEYRPVKIDHPTTIDGGNQACIDGILAILVGATGPDLADSSEVTEAREEEQ